ncbi:hypothetical protein GQR58_030091 [Nymphon striatum]|nr:hypothetical protein GQR58_030091 [Nymphon striatum]
MLRSPTVRSHMPEITPSISMLTVTRYSGWLPELPRPPQLGVGDALIPLEHRGARRELVVMAGRDGRAASGRTHGRHDGCRAALVGQHVTAHVQGGGIGVGFSADDPLLGHAHGTGGHDADRLPNAAQVGVADDVGVVEDARSAIGSGHRWCELGRLLRRRADGRRDRRVPRSAVVTTAEMYLSLELAAEHVRDTGRALRDQQCVDDVGAVVVVDVARIGVDAHGVVAQRAGAAVLADAGTELCDHEGVGDVDGDAAIHVARELGANQAADGVAGQLRRRLGEALLDGECERCGVEHVAGRDVYGQQLGGCGPTRRGHGLEDDQTRCGLGAGHPCCAGRARGEFDQGWIEADRGTYGRSGGRARAKKSAIAARANTVMLVLIRPMSVVPNALGEQECVGQVDVAVVVEVGGDVCPRW